MIGPLTRRITQGVCSSKVGKLSRTTGVFKIPWSPQKMNPNSLSPPLIYIYIYIYIYIFIIIILLSNPSRQHSKVRGSEEEEKQEKTEK